MKYSDTQIKTLLLQIRDAETARKLEEAINERDAEIGDLVEDLYRAEAECLDLQDEVQSLESQLDEKS